MLKNDWCCQSTEVDDFSGDITTLTLISTPTVPGDFNYDGTVDGADYVSWRKNDGRPEAHDAWRAHFGSSLGSGGGSALPSAESLSAIVLEPTSFTILAFGMILFAVIALHRRPHHPSTQRVLVGTFHRAPTALALAILAVAPAATSGQATTFVTYDFGGVITESNSSLVDVGDRFSGQFTFDLATPDEETDLSWGSYRYGDILSGPPVAPVSMSYSVGSVSHSTGWVLSFDVFDNDAGEDDFLVDSDNFGFGSSSFWPPHTYGHLGLYDFSQHAFSSALLPTELNLQDFNLREFRGKDATQKQCCFFEGKVDTLTLASPGRLPRDYNKNGVVDAADYVVWRKTDGTQAGYDAWRADFGTSLGVGSGSAGYPLGASARSLPATVPEPANLALVAFALLIVLRMPRSRSTLTPPEIHNVLTPPQSAPPPSML